MSFLSSLVILTIIMLSESHAATVDRRAVQTQTNQTSGSAAVVVQLDYGSFRGKTSSDEVVETYTGVPYAEPTVGKLRFTNPTFPKRKYENFDATKIAPGCTQLELALSKPGTKRSPLLLKAISGLAGSPFFKKDTEPGQEDCLTLDIARPAKRGKKLLPVMMWIHGGGFSNGASRLYDGTALVRSSVSTDLPMIYVAANYRLNIFGFLGGSEIGEAKVGNLGIKDQRLAMQWIQKYIKSFGGDPSKVTIVGESAGAFSVSAHLLAHGGKPKGLFRAAICESGTVNIKESLAKGAGQTTYDQIANLTGCAKANGGSSLECLRAVPYAKLVEAAKEQLLLGSGGFSRPIAPYVDGDLFTDTSANLIAKKKVAKVPFITGTEDDEGTLLSLSTLAIKDEQGLKKFNRLTFPKASDEQINKLFTDFYPQNVSQGSPFDTGEKNVLTPVSKQISAFLGDQGFLVARRAFVKAMQSVMPIWVYVDKGMKNTPYLGALHASEIPALFGMEPDSPRVQELQGRWLNFITNMVPDAPGLVKWEKYGSGDGRVLEFRPDNKTSVMIDDTYRKEATDWLTENKAVFG